MSENLKFIVGCDIRAYSKLTEKNKESITSHLYAAHISSCGNAQLTHDGFNDTGDGFFVTFPDTPDNQKKYLEYISRLQNSYSNPAAADIQKLVRYHWLRIAAGIGAVSFIVDRMNFMRSDQIDLIARLLDASKLPVPLIMSGSGLMPQDDEIQIADKHGHVLSCRPYYLDQDDSQNPSTKQLTATPDVKFPGGAKQTKRVIINPFYLLKRQSLPLLFHSIDESTWQKFNEYIYFTDVLMEIGRAEESNNVKYLAPFMFFGHTLKDVTKTLSALSGFYQINKKKPSSGAIKLLFVDPDSPDAKNFNIDETDDPGGKKTIFCKLVESLDALNDFFSKTTTVEEIEIYFSDKLITKGIHKILDYMAVIHYGDDHRRVTAGYELLNFFGTADERERFMDNIDNYFSKLVNNQLTRVSVSKPYKPKDIKYLTESLKFDDFLDNLDDELATEQVSTIQYKGYLRPELRDFINRSRSKLSKSFPTFRQIEIHPSDKCNYKCDFCQGAPSKPIGTIPLEIYRAFFASVTKGSIKQVIVSGEYTEPCMYESFSELIKLIVDLNLPIGLYTNGTLNLASYLETLQFGLDNYIVFNLPCSTKSLIRVTNRGWEEFETIIGDIKKNFELLIALRNRDRLPRIIVNYEISDENLNIDNIQQTAGFLKQFDIPLVFKITIPVMPLKDVGDSTQINNIKIRILRTKKFMNQLGKEDYGKVKIQYSLRTSVRNRFSNCYALLDALVIRSDGRIAPCCYTANARYDQLSYADIIKCTFQDVINLRNTQGLLLGSVKPKHCCPPCSKKDSEINEMSLHYRLAL